MENVRYLKNKKIMLYLKLTFCLGNLLTFSLSNNRVSIYGTQWIISPPFYLGTPYTQKSPRAPL